jgi:hypothetical protein
MRRGIVEGEPGMFPDPIARLFVAISRFVRRRSGAEKEKDEKEKAEREEPPPETTGGDTDEARGSPHDP